MFKDLSVYTGCFYSQQILIIHIPIVTLLNDLFINHLSMDLSLGLFVYCCNKYFFICCFTNSQIDELIIKSLKYLSTYHKLHVLKQNEYTNNECSSMQQFSI